MLSSYGHCCLIGISANKSNADVYARVHLIIQDLEHISGHVYICQMWSFYCSNGVSCFRDLNSRDGHTGCLRSLETSVVRVLLVKVVVRLGLHLNREFFEDRG